MRTRFDAALTQEDRAARHRLARFGRLMDARTEEFCPLTVGDYAAQALTTDQGSDGGSLAFPLLGLFGETGSLLSEVKKKQRDRASYVGYAAAVVEELGDVLWYLTTVAARGGLTLDAIVADLPGVVGALSGGGLATFASLQPEIMPRAAEPTAAFEHTLLRLAGEVGLLVIDQEAGRLLDRAVLATRLGAITRTLIQAANEAGVTLEAAAVKNIAKIFDRWPRERTYPGGRLVVRGGHVVPKESLASHQEVGWIAPLQCREARPWLAVSRTHDVGLITWMCM